MSEGNDNLIEGDRHENIYPKDFEIGSIKPFHPSGNPKDSEEDPDKLIPFRKPSDKELAE